VLSSGQAGTRPAPAQVVVDGREPVAPAAGEQGSSPPALAAGEVEEARVSEGEGEGEGEGARTATSPAAAGDRATASAAPSASPASARATTAVPASPTAGTRTHRVEWGETWFGIARRYGVPSAALAAANPGVQPERIRTGQVLRIPGADPALRGGQRSHTVSAGDSLWGIARRYGVTMERIRAANRLPDDQVRLGQTLIIPPPETSR
jgi:LysM repeat protein